MHRLEVVLTITKTSNPADPCSTCFSAGIECDGCAHQPPKTECCGCRLRGDPCPDCPEVRKVKAP